jgi:hypothetical protein
LVPPPITHPAHTNEERILEHVANIDRIVSMWWTAFKLAAFVGFILWAATIAALFMLA